jgi:hypothetical protein
MSDLQLQPDVQKAAPQQAVSKPERTEKPRWETPKLEDVSEQVMAQPYIRFT